MIIPLVLLFAGCQSTPAADTQTMMSQPVPNPPITRAHMPPPVSIEKPLPPGDVNDQLDQIDQKVKELRDRVRNRAGEQ